MTEGSQVVLADQVWGEQLNNLQARGYVLPAYGDVEQFVPLPDTEKLKLGPALLVNYEMSIDQQCRLLGIKNCLRNNYPKDWHLPSQCRWGWIYGLECGKAILGRSANDAIDEFESTNRRGLTIVEGLALFRENSLLLESLSVNLVGSRFGGFDGSVPEMCIGGDGPLLYDNWRVWGHFRKGSASCVLDK